MVALALFASPEFANACCMQIPQIYASPAPTPGFHGARGGANRPFLEPGGELRVGYMGYDPTPAPSFPPPGDLTVTLVFKPANQPPGQETRQALILKPGDSCTQEIENTCEGKLYPNHPKKGYAKCLAMSPGELDVIDNQVRFRLPDSLPPYVRLRGGPLTVAVTIGGVVPCGLGEKSCRDWLAQGTPDTSKTLICVDDFDHPSPASTPRPDFSYLMGLPQPNNYRSECFKAPELCRGSEEEVRYAIDKDRNILLPMLWVGVFPSPSPSVPPPGRVVRGDVVPAKFFAIPTTSTTPGLLESFSAEGQKVNPRFEVASGANARAVALTGTLDTYYSILRIRSHYCTNNTDVGTACAIHSDCPSGWRCVDIGHELDAVRGQGIFARGDEGICQDSPAEACSDKLPCASSETRCVGYVLTAATATPAPVASPAPIPIASLPEVKKQVEQFFGANWKPAIGEYIGDHFAISETRIAVIVDASVFDDEHLKQMQIPDAARTNHHLLMVARRIKVGSGEDGDFQVVSDRGTLQTAERIGQFGVKTRFLAAEPLSTAASGKDVQPTLAASVGPNDRFLKIYDPQKNLVTVVAIADAAAGNNDPMREGPQGQTTFVSPAGRCMTANGPLFVPSLCRPGAVGDCPPYARCEPARVVVAVDLSADADEDGVPDALARPSVPARQPARSSH